MNFKSGVAIFLTALVIPNILGFNIGIFAKVLGVSITAAALFLFLRVNR